jgi:hypothetical protein
MHVQVSKRQPRHNPTRDDEASALRGSADPTTRPAPTSRGDEIGDQSRASIASQIKPIQPNTPREKETPWEAEFARRSHEALCGLHHPLLHELILLMSPLHNSLDTDAQVFAERLIKRMVEDGVGDKALLDLVGALRFAPSSMACSLASDALLDAYLAKPDQASCYLAESSARCDYYAAVKNCPSGAYLTSGQALIYATNEALPHQVQLHFFQAALGWLLKAARYKPGNTSKQHSADPFCAQSHAVKLGIELVDRLKVCLWTPP